MKQISTGAILGVVFVVTLLAVPVFLMVLAMGQSKNAARRVMCMNNMRNLSLASMQYDTVRQQLPGWANLVCPHEEFGIEDPDQTVPGTWVFALLPYIEEGDLYYLYGPDNTDTSSDSHRCMKQGPPQKPLRILVCPNDASDDASNRLSFAANCGLRDRNWDTTSIGTAKDMGGKYVDIFLEPPANGVFHNRYQRGKIEDGQLKNRYDVTQNSLAYISAGDGTSMSLMFSENLDATHWPGGTTPDKLDVFEGAICFCWTAADPTTAAADPSNGMRIGMRAGQHPGRAPRPSSNHSGGVNVLFCDAHSAFINTNIDWLVWCSLHSPNNRQVSAPNVNRFDPNHPRMRPFQSAPQPRSEEYEN